MTARFYANNIPSLRKDVACHRFTVDDKHNWTTDESGDELRLQKDRFIELAQAALEQAKREEEEKGLLQELLETLLEHTGAPMVADVILEQIHSQDVIEKLAEDHFIQQRRRSSYENDLNTLKEPEQQFDLVHSNNKQTYINSNNSHHPHHHSNSNNNSNLDTILTISEYLWRLFRLLMLSSIVGLVYHFMCANPTQHPSLFDS